MGDACAKGTGEKLRAEESKSVVVRAREMSDGAEISARVIYRVTITRVDKTPGDRPGYVNYCGCTHVHDIILRPDDRARNA